MSWNKIGLKTPLQISLEMCERVEFPNDLYGDGSEEFVHYGQSSTGNGWGSALVGECGDGEGFGFLNSCDIVLDSLSRGEGWGDASFFITRECDPEHDGDGISSS